ncbi:MAG: metallophosphoesterase family protein, partial [Anaerolineae bacterium]
RRLERRTVINHGGTMPPTIRFAHLSDIHLSKDGNQGFMASEEATQFAARTIEALNNRPDVDFIFISGDCLNNAHQAELARFKTLVAACQKPLFIVPGNHDGNLPDEPQVFTQRQFAAAFNPHYARRPPDGQAGYFSVSVKPGVQFIGLDTAIPGRVGGEVDPPQLEWLAHELRQHRTGLVIVGCHHPLHPLCALDTAGKWRDWFVCANGAQVQAALDSCSAVKLVLCGHHHLSQVFAAGGQLHVAAPALASYPCGYRLISLTAAGDGWHIDWETHFLPPPVRERAARLLQTSDFALEFDLDSGKSFVEFAGGRPFDARFSGSLAAAHTQARPRLE